MSKVQGTGQKQPGRGSACGRAPAAFLCWVLCPLSFCLLLAGCKSTPPKGSAGDPLLTGGAPLPRNPGKTGPGPAQGTAGTGQGTTGQPQASIMPPVPGIPTSGPGFSPASLATGRRPPFDPNRDLQINDWPRSAPGNSGGGWNAPGNPARSNGSGVTLRPPEPVNDHGGLPPPSTPPIEPSPSHHRPPLPTEANDDIQQLTAKLQARGLVYQKPEMIGPGEWQFTCGVRHPHNPQQQRTYQARGRDLIEAMQAVLQKIDRDAR